MHTIALVIVGIVGGCVVLHAPPVQRVMGRAVIDNTAKASKLPRGLVKASLRGGAR